MNRIGYICAAAASTVLYFGGVALSASEKSGDSRPMVFVQTAPAASMEDGKLTLMTPSTVFFANQPGMLAGHMPCHKFIRAWSVDNSFQPNPPKAVLTAFTSDGKAMKMNVTLQNPRFEGPNLVYDSNIQKTSTAVGGARLFEAALFMDDDRLTSGPYHMDILPDGTVTGPLQPDANGG